MREIESCEKRLKNMMILNKQETPQNINRLLKAEILFILKNYCDIIAEDLNLDISISDTGNYVISIVGECRNLKIAHMFS